MEIELLTLYMHSEQVTDRAGDGPTRSHRYDLSHLLEFIDRCKPLFVLTGAGCSTASGIPDYRDSNGEWKHTPPVQYQDFLRRHPARQRYWARSMAGWPRVHNALPNPAHQGLASLEQHGLISTLVTQNVDGLHHKAGQQNIIELHGSIHQVRCLDCDRYYPREYTQDRLLRDNPQFGRRRAAIAPDGDARLEAEDLSTFNVPDCDACGGLLKPDVVFFGEPVPKPRVARSFSLLKQANGMIIIGSSLMVYSGYRFCRFATEQDIPMAAVNLGRTRADPELTLKIEADCAETMLALSVSITTPALSTLESK